MAVKSAASPSTKARTANVASLLVALHLGERRALLGAFLDGLGLEHEEGVLKDEETPEPLSAETAARGVEALAARFDESQVRLYLNTLWLQDPDRWGAVEAAVQSRLS